MRFVAPEVTAHAAGTRIATPFISGIVGRFVWELGIAAAIALPMLCLNSLTLSPSLAAMNLRGRVGEHDAPQRPRRFHAVHLIAKRLTDSMKDVDPSSIPSSRIRPFMQSPSTYTAIRVTASQRWNWAAAGLINTDLSFLSFLELYRTGVAERRMTTRRVVRPSM